MNLHQVNTLRGRSRAGAVRSWAVRAVAIRTGLNSSTQNRPKQEVNLGQLWRPTLANWDKISKNKPPSATFAPSGDNMAQEPDRYHLPVFWATPTRFGPLTQVRKFENFQKILHPQPLGPSLKFSTLVGGGIPQGEKWGPQFHFRGVTGSKF